MNHDISLKDLLMVPDGPPEAVWQSALQSAFDSVPRPEDEDTQSRIEPENVVTTEGTAAVESDSGAEDDLYTTHLIANLSGPMFRNPFEEWNRSNKPGPGEPFNTALHNRVAGISAPDPDLAFKIARVFGPGWRSVEEILRPADVEV